MKCVLTRMLLYMTARCSVSSSVCNDTLTMRWSRDCWCDVDDDDDDDVTSTTSLDEPVQQRTLGGASSSDPADIE